MHGLCPIGTCDEGGYEIQTVLPATVKLYFVNRTVKDTTNFNDSYHLCSIAY